MATSVFKSIPLSRKLHLKKAFYKTKIAVVIPLMFSAMVNAQVQSQSTSAYETVPPNQNQLDYDVPPVSERSDLLQDNAKVAVKTLELYEIIPSGNQATRKLVDDSVINQKLSAFVRQFDGQISFNELRRIANELTLHFRDTGELLTRVFIPAQTVKDGVFTLAVLKGTLGKVIVSGNESADVDVFQSAFASQRNQVIQRDAAESALLRVQNLYPGVTSIGVFGPGDSLGESDITIEVTGEDKFSGYAFVDNHGSTFTGELRAGVHFELNNLIGSSDKISIDVLANEKPEGEVEDASACCIGGIKYETYTSDLRHSFGAEVFRTTYDVGDVGDLSLAALRLSGESTRLRLFGNFHSTVSRSTTTVISYGVSKVEAENFVFNPALEVNINTSLDELAELDLGYQFSHFTKGGSIYYGKLIAVLETQEGILSLPSNLLGYSKNANDTNDVSQGTIAPSRVGANVGNSLRVTSDLNAIYKISDGFRIKFRLNAQYSNDILVPVQQIGLAGPTAVRAYPAGAYVGDSGGVISTDLIYNFGQYGSISAFYDVGYGEKNAFAAAEQEENANLAGYGLGLELRYKNILTFNLTAAWAQGVIDNDLTLGQGGREAAGRDEPQVFASLSVKF